MPTLSGRRAISRSVGRRAFSGRSHLSVRTSFLWPLLLVLALVLAGCVPATQSPAAMPPASVDGQSINVTDQTGTTVSLPEPAHRAVSTYGMATLYVYAVGAGDRLAAATFFGAKDPEVQKALSGLTPNPLTLPNPGGQQDASIEEIGKVEPDLLLVSSRSAGQETMQELGVPMVRYQGETLEALKEAILLTGDLFGSGASARGERLVSYIDEHLAGVAKVSEEALAGDPKRVYVSGSSPLKTAGKDMLQSEMVALAGGVNVAEELPGYWPEVSLEQVALWDPEVIFVVPYTGASVEAILESPEWAGITAVRNGQVFMMPRYLSSWDTPVPEAILGIEWMAGKLYPASSLSEGCEERVGGFYQDFFDLTLPAEDQSRLCS